MNARGEDCSLQHRAQDIGEEKIGDSFQLISSRGMTRNLQTQLAQMLHRAPHLGAGGAQLLGNAVPLITTVALSLSRRTMRPKRASVEPSGGRSLRVGAVRAIGRLCANGERLGRITCEMAHLTSGP